jgi:hypothetical protein
VSPLWYTYLLSTGPLSLLHLPSTWRRRSATRPVWPPCVSLCLPARTIPLPSIAMATLLRRPMSFISKRAPGNFGCSGKAPSPALLRVRFPRGPNATNASVGTVLTRAGVLPTAADAVERSLNVIKTPDPAVSAATRSSVLTAAGPTARTTSTARSSPRGWTTRGDCPRGHSNFGFVSWGVRPMMLCCRRLRRVQVPEVTPTTTSAAPRRSPSLPRRRTRLL